VPPLTSPTGPSWRLPKRFALARKGGGRRRRRRMRFSLREVREGNESKYKPEPSTQAQFFWAPK